MTRKRVISYTLSVLATMAATSAAIVGCSSKTSSVDPSSLTYGTTVSVTGPGDTHCAAVGDAGAQVQTTSQTSCHPTDAAIATWEAEQGDASDDAPTYGSTMWDTSGSDDDCKYNVQWQSTTAHEDQNVYFKVTANNRTDGTPLTGSNPKIELVDPATNYDLEPASQSTTEVSPGVYYIGPIQFNGPSVYTDAGGGATNDQYVRFHFFENCDDTLPDSPHGHAAFYMKVP